MFNYSIPVSNRSKKYKEAKNLFNPVTGNYFTQDELLKPKNQGKDL